MVNDFLSIFSDEARNKIWIKIYEVIAGHRKPFLLLFYHFLFTQAMRPSNFRLLEFMIPRPIFPILISSISNSFTARVGSELAE